MNKVSALLVVAACGLCGAAFAHGNWPPEHGGVMSQGGETSVEMVLAGRTATFFVTDHGEPVQTAGASGTVEVREAGRSTRTYVLKAGAGNTMIADDVVVSQAARIFVRAQYDNGITFQGRIVWP